MPPWEMEQLTLTLYQLQMPGYYALRNNHEVWLCFWDVGSYIMQYLFNSRPVKWLNTQEYPTQYCQIAILWLVFQPKIQGHHLTLLCFIKTAAAEIWFLRGCCHAWGNLFHVLCTLVLWSTTESFVILGVPALVAQARFWLWFSPGFVQMQRWKLCVGRTTECWDSPALLDTCWSLRINLVGVFWCLTTFWLLRFSSIFPRCSCYSHLFFPSGTLSTSANHEIAACGVVRSGWHPALTTAASLRPLGGPFFA